MAISSRFASFDSPELDQSTWPWRRDRIHSAALSSGPSWAVGGGIVDRDPPKCAVDWGRRWSDTEDKAKGREFSAVAVIDVHEGRFPHFTARSSIG